MEALRAQWDAAKQRRDEIHGGLRLRFVDSTFELRPGRFTFHQRREIKRRVGATIEELIFEISSGQGSPETVAGLAWAAAYQAAPTSPPDIEAVFSWVAELDPREDIDVDILDDEEPEVDAADPTQSEPSLQGSERSQLSLPDSV
jgi:hypothetical protein